MHAGGGDRRRVRLVRNAGVILVERPRHGHLLDVRTQAEISYIDTQFDKAHPGIKAALFNKGKQLGIALGGVGDYVLF